MNKLFLKYTGDHYIVGSQSDCSSEVTLENLGFAHRIIGSDVVTNFRVRFEGGMVESAYYHPGRGKLTQDTLRILQDILIITGNAKKVSMQNKEYLQFKNNKRLSTDINSLIEHFHESSIYPVEGYYIDWILFIRGRLRQSDLH